WKTARSHGPPGKGTMLAVASPEVWREPFTAQAITCPAQVGRIGNPSPKVGRIGNPSGQTGRIGNPSHADEVIFQTLLPAGRAGRSGTLRVRGSWHYQVFVGESWVGEGEGPDLVNAFDISQYLGWTER